METLVRILGNNKIVYFNKSGFFNDKLFPVVWVNFSHMDKKINPWKDIPHKRNKNKIYIDLFHDPIQDSKNDTGYVFSGKIRSISDFDGDLSLFGDIHHRQHFRKNKTAAFCGSFIQQNYVGL